MVLCDLLQTKLSAINTIKPPEIAFMDLLQKNKLLYSRAGFGISLAEYKKPKEINDAVESSFPNAVPTPLSVISPDEWEMNNPSAMKSVSDEQEKKEMKKDFRKRTEDLNLLWIDTMVRTDYPLAEKTALFWHGHFATHIDNPYYDQKLLDIFRSKGLGNFGDLLREVSKSSSMLQFLNNQQNKKKHPNENFAREVMELFTLGRGHYTEDDVKEAARAFTGWAFDGNGDFIFRINQHDTGEKNFLGKTGNFNGDDILEIILQQKQTALFITGKIYRFFVSDEKIDENHVQTLAKEFYNSHYDIRALLTNIFTSDWFYKQDIVGAKIKSPVELLVGYQRMLPITFNDPKIQIHIQRILGQHLFNPPGVAGWAGGKNWIDSSSLVVRMRLPEALLGNAELYLNLKDVTPESGGMRAGKQGYNQREQLFRLGKEDADWAAYLNYWKQKSATKLDSELANYLLNVQISDPHLQDALSFSNNSSNEEFIKSFTIRLMELPEYQLA